MSLKEIFPKCFSFFAKSFLKKKSTLKSKKENNQKHEEKEKNYFERARAWADDLYGSAADVARKYQIAFFSSLSFSALLLLTLLIVVFHSHTALVIVHEGESGDAWVSTADSGAVPPLNWAREASEIAHYVRIRESYDPLLYADQATDVERLSDAEVKSDYALAQSADNKNAPINVLAAKGYRTVEVQNILPLNSVGKKQDSKHPQQPVAQVDFTVTDHFFGETQTIDTPYTALVSWHYTGTPTNPEDMLRNWDGFQITKYVVEPVDFDPTLPTPSSNTSDTNHTRQTP